MKAFATNILPELIYLWRVALILSLVWVTFCYQKQRPIISEDYDLQ